MGTTGRFQVPPKRRRCECRFSSAAFIFTLIGVAAEILNHWPKVIDTGVYSVYGCISSKL